MKKIFVPVLALSMLAGPLAAQESPMQMAQRLDACDGREILSAEMTADGRLAVRCVASAASDGIGLGAPLIGLGVLGVGVAALASGSSSSDTQ